MTRPEEENLGRIPRLLQSIKYMLWNAQASAMVLQPYVLSLCWLVMTLCCPWQEGSICSRGLLPAVLEKVLFNRIPIKCFINIYYSLVAVIGDMHLPRRAQMKYSMLFPPGEGGENDSLAVCVHCVVFKWWCRSSVCEQWGVLCSKFPRQDLVWSSWQALVERQHCLFAQQEEGAAALAQLQLWQCFTESKYFQGHLTNCKVRTHWARCDPTGAGLHRAACSKTSGRAAFGLAPQWCYCSDAVGQTWNVSSEMLLESLWAGHRLQWMTDSFVRLLVHSYNSLATSPGDKWV